MTHCFSEKQTTDPEILSGMLSAINDFVNDSMGGKGQLEAVEYGDKFLVLESGKKFYIVAIVRGQPDRKLHDCIGEQVNYIEKEYSKELAKWNGVTDIFEDCKGNLIKIIMQSTAKGN